MTDRKPIEVGEWYHCYNRGVDKRKVFLNTRDYERMLLLMFLAKNTESVRLFSTRDTRLKTILAGAVPKEARPIIEIGAYALMPNHFHFVLKEIREGGIALFMQRVFTGYTMYFNQKHDRTGALFAGTFKSKHVADDRYLKHLISYVHLNPIEIFDWDWKDRAENLLSIEKKLRTYQYSSLPEFVGEERPHKLLLGNSIFELFDQIPTMQQMLREARIYQALQTETDEV